MSIEEAKKGMRVVITNIDCCQAGKVGETYRAKGKIGKIYTENSFVVILDEPDPYYYHVTDWQCCRQCVSPEK